MVYAQVGVRARAARLVALPLQMQVWHLSSASQVHLAGTHFGGPCRRQQQKKKRHHHHASTHTVHGSTLPQCQAQAAVRAASPAHLLGWRRPASVLPSQAG
jgi:hypothetical protein